MSLREGYRGMSIIDLERVISNTDTARTYENSEKDTGKSKTDVSTDHTSDTVHSDTSNMDAGVATDDSGKRTTIVMSGPLSNIYTQALNVAYSKKAISSESSEIDSTLDIVEYMDKKADEDADDSENNEKLFVHVTDGDHINKDPTGEFNKLSVALDSGKFKQAIVAIETRDIVNRSHGILEDYLARRGVEVIHSRRSMLDYLERYIELHGHNKTGI